MQHDFYINFTLVAFLAAKFYYYPRMKNGMLRQCLTAALVFSTVFCIQFKVQAHSTAAVRLNFFVVEGPNNLLGRFALEKLWPAEYRASCDVASIGSVVASVKLVKKEERSPKKEDKSDAVKSGEAPKGLQQLESRKWQQQQ